MKRKVKKFNEGGKTYDKEDEGLFGGKINYREEDGRKYVAGKANPFDRNPQEQRYYSVDDVKGKLSSLFGGKKEAPKSVDSEPVGDANKSSSYNTRATDNKSEEAPRRKYEDYIKKSEPEEPAKPAGKTHVNEGYKEEPAKKVTKKVTASKATDKVGKGYEDVTRALRGSEIVGKGYENLDPRSPQEKSRAKGQGVIKYEKGRSMSDWSRNLGKKPESDEEDKPSRSIFATKSPNRSYKSGGSVKSASARADGCAIRGKTRA
jgi:hypothetical protein